MLLLYVCVADARGAAAVVLQLCVFQMLKMLQLLCYCCVCVADALGVAAIVLLLCVADALGVAAVMLLLCVCCRCTRCCSVKCWLWTRRSVRRRRSEWRKPRSGPEPSAGGPVNPRRTR